MSRARAHRTVGPVAFAGIAACASVLAFVASACTGKDPYNPGAPLGSYHVTGKLLANECGDATSAPATWEFDIKLSRDGTTLYWVQGGLPVQGVLDANAHAKMTSSGTTKIHDADPRAGIGYCGITRDDTLDVTMAADDASFVGTIAYRFSAADGSDCTDQLAMGGGPFPQLPCTTRYDLGGARTALPKTTPKY
jgi:hypothetical protein